MPVTATLAYAGSLKVQGRFGDQVTYSELGVRQNESFNISRTERREGTRRFVDWIVQPKRFRIAVAGHTGTH